MRIILSFLLLFGLVACDGFDIDAVDDSASSDKQFSKAELAYNILFSSTLLNNSGFNNRDGFIILFDTSATLDQIGLQISSDDNALAGNYPWTIVNDKLQVSYPNGVTCTSTKTSETTLQFTASSSCSGGEPENDHIRNTSIQPQRDPGQGISLLIPFMLMPGTSPIISCSRVVFTPYDDKSHQK